MLDSERNGNADIFVMNIDGTDLVQLTDSLAKEDHGAWSPDSRRLAFGARSGSQLAVVMVALDDSEATLERVAG